MESKINFILKRVEEIESKSTNVSSLVVKKIDDKMKKVKELVPSLQPTYADLVSGKKRSESDLILLASFRDKKQRKKRKQHSYIRISRKY